MTTATETLEPTLAEAPEARPSLRKLHEITPPEIFAELERGVLGQERALRFVSVAIFKHTTGRLPGNILMIGNSGTASIGTVPWERSSTAGTTSAAVSRNARARPASSTARRMPCIASPTPMAITTASKA